MSWTEYRLRKILTTLNAGENPPAEPKNNQLWLSLNDYSLSRWNGTKWAKAVEISISTENELIDLINKAGSNLQTAVISEKITLTADITFPSNILLKFLPGGMLDGNVTATINGGIDAGLYQIFGNDLVLSGFPNILEAYAEWFGVSTLNSDNSYFLQKAWEKTKQLKVEYLRFGSGKYIFLNPVQLTGRGLRLRGAGTIPKSIFKNQYPDETNWTGTVLDFRPIGTNNTEDLLTFGDNNIQVNHFGLEGISVIGNTDVGYNIVRIKYAPQKLMINDLLILQTGNGNGIKISDVWTGCKIENVWCWNTNGKRDSIDNFGFWLIGERNSGGNIQIYNLNTGGFKTGRMFGKRPTDDLTGVKAQRTIFMQASQSIDADIGLYIGYGITETSIFNDWNEGISKKGIKIAGNAREIGLYECRVSGYQLTPGGVGIELGVSDSEGYTESQYKRAKVIINNCRIHGLQPSTRGIVRYKQGQDELFYLNNTVITKDAAALEDSDIYGVMFKGDNNPNRSVVFNQVDFTGGSINASIPENQRIVKCDENETTITDGTSLLKFYTPALYSEEGRLYNYRVDNIKVRNSIDYLDWTQISTNAYFLSDKSSNFIEIANLNGSNRAIFLPKTTNSKGKFFIIKFTENSNLFANIRYHSTEGSNIVARIYKNESILVYNLNGSWDYIYLKENKTIKSKTNSYTLNYAELNKIWTNTGASTGINFTLPAISNVKEGDRITFIVTEDFPITITPNSNDRIIPLTTVDGTAILSSVLGDTIELIATNNNWYVLNNKGFA